jgi:peptidoglycan hydrolase-like protein with peptidoglycan-binding domain
MSLRVAIIAIACCVSSLGMGAAQTQSGASLKQAQTMLKEQGYYQGSVDGINGPQTRAAIQKFQQDHSLKATGRLDADTTASLKSSSAGTVHQGMEAAKQGAGEAKSAVRTDESNAVSSDKPQGAGKEAETGAKQGASDTSSAAKGVGAESKDAVKEAGTGAKKGASDAGNATKGAFGAVKGAVSGDSSKKKDTTK